MRDGPALSPGTISTSAELPSCCAVGTLVATGGAISGADDDAAGAGVERSPEACVAADSTRRDGGDAVKGAGRRAVAGRAALTASDGALGAGSSSSGADSTAKIVKNPGPGAVVNIVAMTTAATACNTTEATSESGLISGSARRRRSRTRVRGVAGGGDVTPLGSPVGTLIPAAEGRDRGQGAR